MTATAATAPKALQRAVRQSRACSLSHTFLGQSNTKDILLDHGQSLE